MAKHNYTELPRDIKLSKDLKDFREFAFTEFSILGFNPAEFEKVFQSFCKHTLQKQSDKLRIAADRI
jgi:hypothetical protein